MRSAGEGDLTEMARLHRAAYGAGHFLALLPEPVLAEYYRPFLAGGSRGLVAEVSESGVGSAQLVGLAVFGVNIEPRIATFKRVQRAAIFRTALRHPVVVARKIVLGTLLGSTPSRAFVDARWLLLSIAVDRSRRGVGAVLLHAMLQMARDCGEERFGLYVRHSNLNAVNAYLRVGFRIVSTIADQYYMELDLRQSATVGTT